MSAEEEFLPIYDEEVSEESVHNEETTTRENDDFVSNEGGGDSSSYAEDERLESREEGNEDEIIDVEEEEEDTRGMRLSLLTEVAFERFVLNWSSLKVANGFDPNGSPTKTSKNKKKKDQGPS